MEVFMSKYRLRVEHDDSPFSPREWDNLGTIGIYHRRYSLSDEGAPVDVEGARNLEDNPQYISLPIYMYDHSGITISTSPFSCPWDSGRVGLIFVSKQNIEKEYGEITDEVLESVYRVLNGEVETFDQYLRGDIWGFVVEKEKVYTAEDGDQIVQWEHVDSCCGFFGEEEAEAEGKAILESYQEDEKVLKF
jgi:hypothetical protein